MFSARRQLGASLRKPDKTERALYFEGLAGGNLVARYSARKWDLPFPFDRVWGYFGEKCTKAFLPLGIHPADKPLIRAIRPLLPDIRNMIEPHEFWSWFTVIRIGQNDAERLHRSAPAVFLLNVKYGTTFKQVGPLIKEIHALFKEHGIKIDVEVRESEWDCQGSSMSASVDAQSSTQTAEIMDDLFKGRNATLIETWHSFRVRGTGIEAQRLRSNLGWEIALSDGQTEYHGTAGVSFKLEGDDRLFASVAKHILPPSVSPGAVISRATSARITRLVETVTGDLAHLAKGAERLEEWELLQAQNSRKQEFYTQLLTALKTQHHEDPAKSRQLRAVGEIHAVETTVASDIAVVRIDESRFKNASNTVWLGFEGLCKFIDILREPHLLYEEEYINARRRQLREADYSIQLSGETFSIQDDTPETLGIPQAAYLHRGAGGGFCGGRPNSIEACVRAKDGKESSWQIVVVGYMGSHSFSRKGDSGSAVMDETGRYIGCVLGGGAKESEDVRIWERECDVSFVTPADRHLKGLRKCLGKELILLRR